VVGEVGEDVDGVVGLEPGQHGAGLARAEGADQLVPDKLVQTAQGLGMEAAAQRLDERLALVIAEKLEQVGLIARMQRPGERRRPRILAGRQRPLDLARQRLAEADGGAALGRTVGRRRAGLVRLYLSQRRPPAPRRPCRRCR
jgi:hypothetical protein